MKNKVRFRGIAICILACFILFNRFFINAFAVEDTPEKDLTFNSVVEIEGYNVLDGYIDAGKESTVILTLHNANNRTSADNIFVSVSSDSGMLYPSYGNDNQFYVGSLEAGETATVSVPLIVNSEFKGDYADLNCTIVYASNGKQITNSSTMILPARDSNTIIVSSVDVSPHATVNNKSLLCINYYNKSTENVNDASLKINGNVSDSTKIIDLGSISGGKTYAEDYNIIFSESGEQTISIELDYTDVNGEQVQLALGSFKVNVDLPSETTVVAKTGNAALKTIGAIIAVLATVAVVVVTVMYIRKR